MISNETDYDLTAIIKSISAMGLVTVVFSKDLYVIKNLSVINETVLHLEILNPENEVRSEIEFTWELRSFLPSLLKI